MADITELAKEMISLYNWVEANRKLSPIQFKQDEDGILRIVNR